MSQKDPLVLVNLTKSYGQVMAVKDVCLTIKMGQVFGLLGPNGAGKTSIISTIMTLQDITEGCIEVFGVNVKNNPRAAKRFIGYTPQELVNHGFFNVEQILKYHVNYYGMKKTGREIDHLLNKLGLYAHKKKYVNQISGGMKRRLMIAKALIHEPKLLLLDEPTAGVDLELRQSLWNLLDELKNQGISILLTTHYLEEAERLCDQIGVLQSGTLKQVDAVEKLLEKYSLKRVSLTLKTPRITFEHALLTSIDKEKLQFRVPPKMTICELLLDTAIPREEILDVETQPGSLEDVMANILQTGVV